MFEGLFERAIPGATTSLKLAIELFGLKSVDLVPSYLILGEASQGLGSLTQAQEYLSQAEWTVAKNADCPNQILSKLYRNMAMLQMVQGNLDHALRNLANDIYCASEEFGTDSIKVSGGYFLMANIYLKLEKMQIADSLYREVTNMWHAHLKEIVWKKTEISDLESILGKKDDDDIDRESVDAARSIELASEAEARKVLYAIYDLRKNETEPDQDEINKIEHCLSMVHFLSKEFDKVEFYTDYLMQRENVDEDTKKMLNRVISFIQAK